ncbi:hypothetical protein GZH47_32700 (plasmid) [Paenibacillus rhizovicinus]|uniref:Uncharacterized protein n=2 Tax=Paenibacillus rhizovicinus TaxID=2704463 RepID=A0A6C0PAZ5_9BACL|nr:hypothetical protein GZH47_32700 [Paenibacillus rhizovicinus]
MMYRAPAPQGNPYVRPNGRVEYQIFNEDYFSGADVHLYFGNIWVDEAVAVAFQLEERVMPIYGYNSFTFDAVARGQRMINGMFTINFKSVGYLMTVLQNANAIEMAVSEAQQSGLVTPDDFKNYKLDDILKMAGKSGFDQIADEYEKALWGVTDDTNSILSYGNRPYFPQTQYGFDIKINYGAVSESMSPQIKNYSTSSYANAKAPMLTVETINGVQLTSMRKDGIGTSSDGAPITETYSFIARDLNGPLYMNQKRI